MDIQSIISIINAVSAADIMNFQVEEGNFKLSIDKLKQKIETMPSTMGGAVTAAMTGFEQVQPNFMRNQPIYIPEPPQIPQTLEFPQDGSGTPAYNSIAEVSLGEADIEIVKSPIVGTFYSASGADVADFVKIEDKVTKGQVLCIIEAMKLMNEIESDFDGEIVEILVKNEQMVEYGQPLFKIKVS